MNHAIAPTLANLLIITSILLFVNLFLYKVKINLDILFFTNVFLLSVASIEPAPSEFIFLSLLIFSMKEKIVTILKYSKMRVVLWLMLLYLAEVALSMLNIEDYPSGFRFYGITIYLIVYSILIFFFAEKTNYLTILRIYIISSTLAAGIGIIGYFGHFSEYLLFGAYRTKALFKDPNVFGSFLTPAVILLIGDFKFQHLFPMDYEKLKSIKILKYIYLKMICNAILILLNTIGIVISYSRGAWVSLVAGIGVLILMNVKQINLRRLFIYLCAFLSAGLLLWYKILSFNTKYFLIERLSIKAYDSDRFAVQRIGFMKALDHVFGYGPGQYELVMKKIIGEEFSAHSLYVRIILENGIFGFALLMFAFAYVIVKLFLTHKKENHSYLSSVYIAISISLLVNSLVIDTLHWRHLWLFYGLSLSFLSEYQRSQSYSNNWNEEMMKLKILSLKVEKAFKAECYLLIRYTLTFIGMILCCLQRQQQEIIILMYHRVNDKINQALAVKEKSFQWQMEYLKKRGYKVISLDEALKKVKSKTIDGKYIVLSFDDGYEDYYLTAYPVLKQYNYPSIQYLVPGYIESDKAYPWDQDLEKSKLMNWEQIKNLKEDALFSIGSHTLNHHRVDALDHVSQKNELEESKKILEERLDVKIKHFAYPMGVYDENAKNLLSELYETGVLIDKGIAINDQIEPNEYFTLMRVPVYRRDGKYMFIARLNGWTWLEMIVRRKFRDS